MIARARRRLGPRIPKALALAVGDVTTIDAADASFDAVFDFGTIHPVPDWRAPSPGLPECCARVAASSSRR